MEGQALKLVLSAKEGRIVQSLEQPLALPARQARIQRQLRRSVLSVSLEPTRIHSRQRVCQHAFPVLQEHTLQLLLTVAITALLVLIHHVKLLRVLCVRRASLAQRQARQLIHSRARIATQD